MSTNTIAPLYAFLQSNYLFNACFAIIKGDLGFSKLETGEHRNLRHGSVVYGNFSSIYGLMTSIPPEIEEAVKDISTDHESGARQLALKALDALKTAIELTPPSRPSWASIVNCAWALTQARPSMGSALQTTLLRALYHIKPMFPSPQTLRVLDSLIAEETTSLNRLCATFTQTIQSSRPKTVLTLSNSSTIVAAFNTLFHTDCPDFTLIILESRPLLEGLALARAILPHKPPNVQLEITTDAAGAYFASTSDLVILGADQLDPGTGAVKNKIGSAAVARVGKRVVCVTSTDKFAEQRPDEEVEENSKEEVVGMWSERLDGVRVRNVYFEWVSGDEVDEYITERGVLGKNELFEIFKERESWRDIWNDLGSDNRI